MYSLYVHIKYQNNNKLMKKQSGWKLAKLDEGERKKDDTSLFVSRFFYTFNYVLHRFICLYFFVPTVYVWFSQC